MDADSRASIEYQPITQIPQISLPELFKRNLRNLWMFKVVQSRSLRLLYVSLRL